MRGIRTFQRYFRDAAKSVIRNFSLSLASISCIAITLIVVSLSIIVSYNVENFMETIKKDVTMVIFLDGDTTEDQRKAVESGIKSTGNVEKLIYKSKEDYAKEFAKENETLKTIIEGWTNETNPLLDSFELKVKDIENIKDTATTIKKLKDEGLWIAAADMDGQTFYEQNLTGALGLVIGSEGFGISRLVKQNCDFTVKMPMIGNVTSLNASVAAGIILYEIFKQRSGNK